MRLHVTTGEKFLGLLSLIHVNVVGGAVLAVGAGREEVVEGPCCSWGAVDERVPPFVEREFVDERMVPRGQIRGRVNQGIETFGGCGEAAKFDFEIGKLRVQV